MPVNKRQHFVSQLTIRRFLGGRDRLFCLDKQTLTIAERVHGNKPADILNRDYYYTTDTDDFDGEVVKPLEDKLGPIFAARVVDPDAPLTRDEMALLTDWCALSISRSIYTARVVPIVYETLSAEEKAQLPSDGKAMTLVARRVTFHGIRDAMLKAGSVYRFMVSPRDFAYYLTDQPAAVVPMPRHGPLAPLLVPLAHNLILIQSPIALADAFYASFKPTLEWSTLVQCGWAERLIYSADIEALERAIFVLKEGSGDYPPDARVRARMPFFGYGKPSDDLSPAAILSPSSPPSPSINSPDMR